MTVSGVMGYTGYIPHGQVIQVAIKDTTVHTGKVRSSTSVRGTGGLVIDGPLTETHAAFTMTPEMSMGMSKDMALRASGALSPYNPFHDGKSSKAKPFVAESTYTQEMLSGARKIEQVLEGGPFVGGTLRPEATGLKNVLYETETQQKTAEALVTAIRAKLERDFRSIEQAASRISFDTSYRRSYGGRDFNPRSTVPMEKRDLSLKASTRELFLGTPKAVEHIPGYCGFITAAKSNARAVEHSHKVHKPSTQRAMLSELGQFPRNLPGYLGFEPSAFANQKDRNRNLSLTTAGRADLVGSNSFAPGELGTSMHSVRTVQYTPSTVGVANSLVSGFFTHAALTVSDNGVHNAEAYYKLLRPLEGRSTAIIKPVSQAPLLTNLV